MSERVLIAYGSKHGSVADTAERIGELLRLRGLEVDVHEAKRVQSIGAYGAIIIGGAIYAGRWHADADRLRKRFARQLATLPVAYFAMGPKTSSPEDIESARRQLARYKLEPLYIFGGVIKPAELRFPFSRLGPTDARDWNAIADFADAFASRVSKPSRVAVA